MGTLDSRRSQGSYIEYPSFENFCFSGSDPETLMLTDQGTFCLSTGHRYCHRFIAAQAAQGKRVAPPAEYADAPALDSESFASNLEEIEHELETGYQSQRSSKRKWGWIGAGMIFMSSILCGGIFAAYIGWQLANTNFAAQPGSLNTLANAPAQGQPQIYLIVTATSEPGSIPPVDQQANPPSNPPEVVAQSGQQPIFPEAVTPTPVPQNLVPLLGTNEANGGVVQGLPSVQEPAQAPVQEQPASVSQTSTQPAIDVQLEVPTRRPTPIVDIQAPALTTPEFTPTPTLTPTPQLGTPFVLFAAEDRELQPGKCTMVTWNVENVRAVYYENLGVDGHGEREECVRDDNEEYVLTVVTANGSTQYYTTTVTVLRPTDTPEPTRTFTPVPAATPTWTPNVPTATPTLAPQYDVSIASVDGESVECDGGSTCEVGLLITNSSTVVDNILVLFDSSGVWSYQLCRLDGVCSNSALNLINIGPANTAFILLKVDVPPDSAAQSESYSVRAVSEGGGAADVTRVEIRSR